MAHKKRVKLNSWTVNEINMLIELWEAKTKQEIAEEMGRDVTAVQSMAARIRKMGYPLIRKTRKGVIEGLILEVFKKRGFLLKGRRK